MIKTSIKFSILFISIFVLINIIYIQPETQALPVQNSSDHAKPSIAEVPADVLPIPVETPIKATDNEAVLPPLVESTVSTRAVNTPSEAGVTKTAAVTESKAEGGAMMGAFRATAYCLRGRTANGGSVRRGIVAADPRVLPLGSTIQINGGGYSGTYVVTDTGGAIRGRILDIWVPSCAEANRFGRRTITVVRLGRGAKSNKK